VLHWSSYLGFLSTVTKLLIHESPTDIKDIYGNSALMRAIYRKHKDVANKILDYNANVNILNT